MQAPGPNVTLRPLGVGEVLDRAVNLCVTYFLPLAGIYVIYAIPVGVLTFFSSQGLSHIVQVLTEQAQTSHGHLSPNALGDAFAASRGSTPITLLLIACTTFLAPLPTAALIEATTAFYLKRSTSFGQAYRVALDRYFPMVGISILYLLAAGALYGVVIVVAIFLILGLVLLTSAAKVFGIALSIVLGTAFAVAGLAFLLVIILAWQIAYFTCVVERASFTAAFASSLRRALSGIGFKRSLLMGAVYFAISIVISLVTGLGEAAIFGLLHSTIVATVYETIVRIATAAFATAFIGIFYLDLRVREEGLDLQLQAQQLNVSAVAP